MKVELIEDLPVLYASIVASGVIGLIDSQYVNHGNQRDLTTGERAACFLLYALTKNKHQLSGVEDWAEARRQVLGGLLGKPDFVGQWLNDDRLGVLVEQFSDDTTWRDFECATNRQFLKVYALGQEPAVVRLDATIAQSFADESDLLRLGYSKHRRADLMQFKTMLATLDPLGLPLCSLIVSGNKTDDELYVPLIDEVSRTLTQTGILYVGDAKLGSIFNRFHISQKKDYYLTPMSKVQVTDSELDAYLALKPVVLTHLYDSTNKEKCISEAYEIEETRQYLQSDGSLHTWAERRIVTYSDSYGRAKRVKFDSNYLSARAELKDLLVTRKGKPRLCSPAQVSEKVKTILTKYKMKGIIQVEITTTTTQKTIRKHKDTPQRTETVYQFALNITDDTAAFVAARKRLGWRVFVTNAPIERLSTLQALQCYHAEYLIEATFHRLLNKTTALMPIFLHKDTRIKGLTRLLLLALKFSAILQHTVRTALADQKETLNQVYPGNPTRKTAKPTTEMLLNAFKGIALVHFTHPDQTQTTHITPLTPIQKRILAYLNLSEDIFSTFASP